jgi:hypothetical protein
MVPVYKENMDQPEELSYPQARSISFFFHRQQWHLISLLILVPFAWLLTTPHLGDGVWLGISASQWFRASMIISIIHQVIVWIVFRLQLGWASLTRLFGKADLIIWGFLFLPLLIGRVATQAALARATQHTLALPQWLAVIIALFLLVPALYTFWSVFRYFGLTRAMVGDHFQLRYRQMPLEKRGIFKYSNNAMYAFGFLLLWAIAFINLSFPALVMAFFQHVYIWVHYLYTEKPDMEIIFPNE